MDYLDAVRLFLRVTELESFSQAAHQAGQPKANASLAVKQLEADLGVRLLHRTTRRVTPTQDGAAFYDRCRALVSGFEEARGMFRMGDQLTGRLRVDMPSRLACTHVVPRLPEFLQKHPHLELEISCTDRRVDLVREGFDCVIRIGPVVDESLHVKPLGVLRMVNCASPGYLQSFGTPRRLSDLQRHQLVHYLPQLGGRPAGWEYVQGGRTAALPVAGVVTVNSTEAYEAAALAGLGIIQCPFVSVADYLATGRLAEVLPRHKAAPLPIALVYSSRQHLPARVRAFMEWLAQVLSPASRSTFTP
jgi:DNA-binding transcriptional LysR family regulator